MSENTKRGGSRIGAGRPKADGETLTERVVFLLSPAQKAKFEELGGARWVREQLSLAQKPDIT